jgi:hypothetical protein
MLRRFIIFSWVLLLNPGMYADASLMVYQPPIRQEEIPSLRKMFERHLQEKKAQITSESNWNPPGREYTHEDLFSAVRSVFKSMKEDHRFFLPRIVESAFYIEIDARIQEYNDLVLKTHHFKFIPNATDKESIQRVIEGSGHLPFAVLAKLQRAIDNTRRFENYDKIIVSGSHNRCWLRSAWLPILEEAFHNPVFYQRLLTKIYASGTEFALSKEASQWMRMIQKLNSLEEEKRMRMYNSLAFDTILSEYGRRLAYKLGGSYNTDILVPFNAGSSYESRSFFEYFNIDAMQISRSSTEDISMPNTMLGSSVDEETVFTDRYVLYGVPGHWDLLKKP